METLPGSEPQDQVVPEHEPTAGALVPVAPVVPATITTTTLTPAVIERLTGLAHAEQQARLDKYRADAQAEADQAPGNLERATAESETAWAAVNKYQHQAMQLHHDFASAGPDRCANPACRAELKPMATKPSPGPGFFEPKMLRFCSKNCAEAASRAVADSANADTMHELDLRSAKSSQAWSRTETGSEHAGARAELARLDPALLAEEVRRRHAAWRDALAEARLAEEEETQLMNAAKLAAKAVDDREAPLAQLLKKQNWGRATEAGKQALRAAIQSVGIEADRQHIGEFLAQRPYRAHAEVQSAWLALLDADRTAEAARQAAQDRHNKTPLSRQTVLERHRAYEVAEHTYLGQLASLDLLPRRVCSHCQLPMETWWSHSQRYHQGCEAAGRSVRNADVALGAMQCAWCQRHFFYDGRIEGERVYCCPPCAMSDPTFDAGAMDWSRVAIAPELMPDGPKSRRQLYKRAQQRASEVIDTAPQGTGRPALGGSTNTERMLRAGLAQVRQERGDYVTPTALLAALTALGLSFGNTKRLAEALGHRLGLVATHKDSKKEGLRGRYYRLSDLGA